MNILYLGHHSPIVHWLQFEHGVIVHDGKIDPLFVRRFDYLISYGYRHILKPEVLKHFPGRAINLHISYLPWNRGANPNYWSWVDNTPKGVTIHHIDTGIDTGDIIAQQEVVFVGEHTLASSYAHLKREMEHLFYAVWPHIETGSVDCYPQPPGGSFHLTKEKPELPLGWNTPVTDLRRPDAVLCHNRSLRG